MSNDWVSWIVFVAICFGAAAIGSMFTASSVKTWYPGLLKPAGTPPPWVFAPVWSALYLMMATAAWLVWRHRGEQEVRLTLALFVGQLALTAAWSFIFFGQRRPGAALVEILLLLGAIGITEARFAMASCLAFWLMTPYICWVAYATYLSFGIWRLNRGGV